MKTYKAFMEEAVDKRVAKLLSKYKKKKTNDYQRRGGNYPDAGVPDTISVSGWRNEFSIEYLFKSTGEREAKRWVERDLGSAAKQFKITTRQDGDYKDDWVAVYVEKIFT